MNPLRAGIVEDMKSLDRYKWCGHMVVMGKKQRDFHDVDYVLKLFGIKKSEARRKYRLFVKKGIDEGKRDDLIGGGLIRSAGGWDQVKEFRKAGIRLKGDERILGSSEFVLDVLKKSEEQLKKKYEFNTSRYDFNYIVKYVADLLNMDTKEVLSTGKQPTIVKARSLLCYFANREIGMKTVEIAKKLKICQSAVSRSSSRGEILAKEHNYKLVDK